MRIRLIPVQTSDYSAEESKSAQGKFAAAALSKVVRHNSANINPLSLNKVSRKKSQPEVFRLKISGPVNTSDPVLQRARQLVVKTGNREMIESFDAAVKKDAFVNK